MHYLCDRKKTSRVERRHTTDIIDSTVILRVDRAKNQFCV
jgi:hypothetical protein